MGAGEINFALNLSYGEDGYIQDTGNSTELWDAFYVQYIFNGIVMPIVAILGVIGNILTMVVIWQKEMQSTTILFLRALVVTDTGIIILGCVSMTPFTISLFHPEMKYFQDVIYPYIFTPFTYLILTIQQINVWITVAVSIERYIAICHPFKAARLCTRKKVFITLGVTSGVAMVYNIPRCLATTIGACTTPNCYTVMTTSFGGSFFYSKVYMVWLYATIIYIIPLTALSILNVLIIKELMAMRARRVGTSMSDDEDQEANLSLVLVLIVVVFILCQTPGLFVQFDVLFEKIFFIKFLAVSNILFVLNSSVNFLIYTLVGQKFRRVLLCVLKKVFSKVISRDVSRTSRLNSHCTTNYEMQTRMLKKESNGGHNVEITEKARLNGDY